MGIISQLIFVVSKGLHNAVNKGLAMTVSKRLRLQQRATSRWIVSRNWSALFHFVVDVEVKKLHEYHFGLYLSPVNYLDAVSTLIRSAANFYIDL